MNRSHRPIRSVLVAALAALGFASIAFAGTTTIGPADFNGDGNAGDYATISDPTTTSTKVTITHGGGAPTTSYTSTRGFWRVATGSELNGLAGQEIAVVLSNGYVFIVDDTAKTKWEKGLLQGDLWKTEFFNELNGVAGKEISFTYANGWVSIIDYKARAERDYNLTFGASWTVQSFANLNGVAGNEIAYTYNVNNAGWVTVIDDKTQRLRSYYMGFSWKYYTIDEMNGRAGKDIFAIGLDTTSLAVIEDSAGGTHKYFIPSGWSSWSLANKDGVAGLEAVFQYSIYQKWVNDRTGSVTTH